MKTKINEIPSFDKLNQQVLSGLATWGNVDVGVAFSKYIDALPWNGTRIDESKMTRKLLSIDSYSAEEETLREYLLSTAISNYKHVGLLYTDNTPILTTTIEEFVNNYSSYLTYPGDLMAFGFDDIENLKYDDFILVFAWQSYAVIKGD